MTRERKPLTQLGLEIILDHNENLSSAAQKSMNRFAEILERGENEDARKQYNYWKNVRSALLWSSGIAWQRTGKNTGNKTNGV